MKGIAPGNLPQSNDPLRRRAATVRGYPVKPDGAGYQAQGVTSSRAATRGFDPSDVCVAPDGSIYVADWMTPVVGGHNMIDREAAKLTGRVYRVAPPGVKPFISELDLQTAAGCVQALLSRTFPPVISPGTTLQKMGPTKEGTGQTLVARTPTPALRARPFICWRN